MLNREIQLEWVEETVKHPELILADKRDSTLERRYRRIEGRENRVLRVVVDANSQPPRIISVFFDRSMRGKL